MVQTTPVYAFPYPEVASDPPNGPTQIQALAQQVEAVLQGNLALGGTLTVPGGIIIGAGGILGADLRADLTAAFTGVTSATMVDITGLAVTLIAGRRYAFEMVFLVTGDSSNDYQGRFTFTNSATWWVTGWGPQAAGLGGGDYDAEAITMLGVLGATVSPVVPAGNPTGGWPCGIADLTNPARLKIEGQVLVGGSNSVVQAQGRKGANTVPGTASQVNIGSYMKFTRIS